MKDILFLKSLFACLGGDRTVFRPYNRKILIGTGINVYILNCYLQKTKNPTIAAEYDIKVRTFMITVGVLLNAFDFPCKLPAETGGMGRVIDA